MKFKLHELQQQENNINSANENFQINKKMIF